MKADKLRSEHAANMLRQENTGLQEQIDQLNEHAEAASTLRSSYDAQLSKCQAAAQKREEEVRVPLC